MLVGIIGSKGSGKTLLQSILGSYVNVAFNIPLVANYELENSEKIVSTRDLWVSKKNVMCLDEFWVSVDSRLWKDNVQLSYWIMQERKRENLIFYTAQIRSEIDIRFRKATDLFITCEKIFRDKRMFKYTFLKPNLMNEDMFSIGRTYVLTDPERYYGLYNTKELMWPIKYSKLTIEEIEQLSRM